MELTVTRDVFRLAQTFTIARGSRTEAQVLTVTIRDGDHVGQGECVPYARYGESLDSVTAQIEALALPLDRAKLQEVLAPGAARNAVDCALWDLEAKKAGKPAWTLAGLDALGPVTTAYSLSLESPEQMQADAAKAAHRPLLKVKLGTPDDIARLEAVRAGAPDPAIVVDANEGWTAEIYAELVPHLQRLGVTMVEQPLPAAEDDALRDIPRPVPVCADESFHDRASLAGLSGKYDMVNIKLDKTGGLTEALAARREAEAAGYGIMIGCMVGSSLAMAPAILLAQGAKVVDLDGPLLLAEDRPTALTYEGSVMHPANPGLWG
ncbi:MAG: N-acetyl-D-Glu racemase DgcA [Pseudomonadota bacterium]